jgi:hypothetical protein
LLEAFDAPDASCQLWAPSLRDFDLASATAFFTVADSFTDLRLCGVYRGLRTCLRPNRRPVETIAQATVEPRRRPDRLRPALPVDRGPHTATADDPHAVFEHYAL